MRLSSVWQKESPVKNSSSELTVDYAAEVSAELSALLGRKVQLLEGRRGGRIELYFYDADDREALIETLRQSKPKQ